MEIAGSGESGRRRLRILHLTAASEAGGLSRYVHDLCRAMHERGHEVRVAGARGAWHGLFERAPFEWVEVPLNGGLASLWRAAGVLRRHLAEHPVDVLHTHYRRATLVGRRLQRVRGSPPILYTVHLSDMPLRWPAKLWADFGDHAHAASADARAWVVQKVGMEAGRVSVVPHGVDVSRWPVMDEGSRRAARERFGLGVGDRVACYVGRLDDPKNEDWLLDVVERVTGLRLLVAGSGPRSSRFVADVGRRGLSERVKVLGELAEPLPVYQASDAFLLPSLREGFSLACAEAMCVGVPVLRTRTAGTSEMIVEGVTGRSCAIERGAFVGAAVEFLSDGEALGRMGRAAALHIREKLTFERQLEGMMALYRRVAGIADVADNAVGAGREAGR